jgi:hypothetical protein
MVRRLRRSKRGGAPAAGAPILGLSLAARRRALPALVVALGPVAAVRFPPPRPASLRQRGRSDVDARL